MSQDLLEKKTTQYSLNKKQNNGKIHRLHEFISTKEELSEYIHLSKNEELAIHKNRHKFPLKITHHYANLLHNTDPSDPLRRIAIPSLDEFTEYPDDKKLDCHNDETKYQPMPGIIHRYPGKVLILPTMECEGHCRFCYRSEKRITNLSNKKLEMVFNYINNNSSIRDVILSGGEPLTIGIKKLDYILSKIRSIKHVEIIRITTHTPVYSPKKIDRAMISMLAKYKPLIMLVSFLHPREITKESCNALENLSNSGITLLQQGPILKGINDNVETLKNLYEKLVMHRVIPYYAVWGIYSPNTRHFNVDKKKAKTIFMALENRTSGFCIPHMSTLDQNNFKTRTLG